jgi:hypothetical protein
VVDGAARAGASITLATWVIGGNKVGADEMRANVKEGTSSASVVVKRNGWLQQGSGLSDPQGPLGGFGVVGAPWQGACAAWPEAATVLRAIPVVVRATTANNASTVRRRPACFTVLSLLGRTWESIEPRLQPPAIDLLQDARATRLLSWRRPAGLRRS